MPTASTFLISETHKIALCSTKSRRNVCWQKLKVTGKWQEWIQAHEGLTHEWAINTDP